MKTMAALCLLVTAATGCSFALVRRPPAGPRESGAPLECTTSRAAPYVDLAIAGLAFGGAILAVDAGSRAGCPPGGGLSCVGTGAAETASAYSALALGAVSVLAIASSMTGFHRTEQCRALAGMPPGALRSSPAAGAAADAAEARGGAR